MLKHMEPAKETIARVDCRTQGGVTSVESVSVAKSIRCWNDNKKIWGESDLNDKTFTQGKSRKLIFKEHFLDKNLRCCKTFPNEVSR